jgi:(heptosyl)LPS beta-1,4-glucosyltransferase
MSRLPLSVVYITLNAERHLNRSLEKVKPIAAEIVMVDCGSIDQTLSIAKAHDVRVISHAWQGFSAQRQLAVDSARHDWILVLDADEILTESGVEAISKVLSFTSDVASYFLQRRSVFHDRQIYHGDWAHDRVLRLFDRRLGHYGNSLVHEAWHSSAPSDILPDICLLHYSYANYAELLDKMRRYATLNAEQVLQKRQVPRAYMPMTHALWAFFRAYILRLGILDGVDGAAIAWTTALGAFMKYAIAREMQLQDKENL